MIWKRIPGFHTLEASNVGTVRRRFAGRGGNAIKHRVLTQVIKGSYAVICHCIDGKRRYLSVHRLICLAFHGRCPKGRLVAHWDGDGLNNLPQNLRWATHKQNSADAMRHGRLVQGERQHLAKLKKSDVIEIRKLLERRIPQSKIAKQFGVAKSQISSISTGRTWKSIP